MEQRPEVLQAADRIINFCFFFAIDDVYYKMIGGAEMTHDVSAIQTILSPVFDSYQRGAVGAGGFFGRIDCQVCTAGKVRFQKEERVITYKKEDGMQGALFSILLFLRA